MRQTIGTVQGFGRLGAAAAIPTTRGYSSLSSVSVQDGQQGTGCCEGVYGGDGIMDSIRGLMTKGKAAASRASDIGSRFSDLYTSETGTMLRNLVPSSDENARPAFPGEKHAILKLPNGKYGTANYMGPGTHLEERLKRGDPPRTMADKVAQAHDSRYALAKSQKDVAAADRKMIAKLKELQARRLDSNVNIQMGLRPIQAKLHAESLGLVKPGSIATFGDSLKSPNRGEVEAKLQELEQEGFGLPGDMLRKKIMGQMKRKQMRKKAAGRGLSVPGGGLGLPGGSLKLAGQGIDPKALASAIAGCVSAKMLPMLLKKLGLPQMGSGKTEMKSLLNMRMLRALNDGASRKTTYSSTNATVGRGLPSKAYITQQLRTVSGEVSKVLLPILVKMAMAKMSGGRMETISAAQLRDQYENPSLMARLSKSLASGAFSLFKKFLSSGAKKGDGMAGSGFFNDFARGFKKGFMGVMKPALKVAPLFL
jgi:hypothetical protein